MGILRGLIVLRESLGAGILILAMEGSVRVVNVLVFRGRTSLEAGILRRKWRVGVGTLRKR